MNFNAYPAERRRALAKVAAWRRWSTKPSTYAQAREMAKLMGVAQGKPFSAAAISHLAKSLLEARV